jgi:methenyltetrahydrofolate cyclohydrolase
MTALADRPLSQLLDEVAARTPAPGGGTSAAWTCALGAGLVEMCARFGPAEASDSEAEARMRALGERAAELRQRALELAERELVSYRPVLEALRLPRDRSDRTRRLDEALSEASEAPLEIAQVAAEVATMGAEVAEIVNAHVRGDAVVSTLLAEAASRSAVRLVEINLTGRSPDRAATKLGEARAAAKRASRASRTVLA